MSSYRDLLPCTRTFIKEMLKVHTFLKHHNSLNEVLSTCLTYIITLLLLIIFPICLIKNFLIKLFLLLYYNKNYEVLSSMDSYLECTKNRISTIYIVEHSGSFEELQIAIEESSNRLFRSHFKFSSTLRSIFGVYYYLKNSVSIKDICFLEDTDVCTKSKLIDYLEEYCFKEWDNQALWRVVIFKNPIKLNGDLEETKTYYPILIRYNHCLGDGISLSVFVQKYFMNDVKNECFEKILRKPGNSRDVLKTSNIGTVFWMGSKLNYSKLDYPNGNQRLAVFIEDEPKYLNLIKYIREQLNCSFTDVITGCAIASIKRYLQTEGGKVENVIVYNTSRPIAEDIEPILQGKSLSNGFTFDAFNLSLSEDDENLGCDNILMFFKDLLPVLKNGRNSGTRQIIHLISNLIPYLHPKLLMMLARYNSTGTTLGISNIPFANYCKIGNYPVKETFSFVNNFEETKFVLVIITYEDRLQATLITKKNLKVSREELQVVLDNAFLNIDRLYEEVKLNEVIL